MKYFLRVLTITVQQRMILSGLVLSSVFIALTWGANIGTVYPMFEVVLRGDSLKDWATDRLEHHKANLAEHELALGQLQDTASSTVIEPPESRTRRITSLEQSLELERRAVSWGEWGVGILNRYAPDDALTTLYLVVGWIVFASAIRFFAVMIHALLVTKLVGVATNSLRREFFHRVLAMDLKAFHQYRVADLINHVNHDLSLISHGIATVVGRTITEPMKIIVCLAGAALISWRFLLLLVVIIPPGMIAMHLLAKSIQSSSNFISQKTSEVCRTLHLSFLSINVVKAYNLESYQEQKLNETANDLLRSSLHHSLIQQTAKLVSEGFVIGVTSVALVIGGHLVIGQTTEVWGIPVVSSPISAGAMIAFFAFLLGTHQPIRRMSDLFSCLQNSEAAARRFYELIDRQPEVASPDNPVPVPPAGGDLKFENVSFAYLEDQHVLNHVDLTIKPGEILAIVGANGSGKSSLINLLTRFYDPTSGRITYGETDLRHVSLKELREQIGLVTQTPILFDDTVAQNIQCGRPDATRAEIIDAAKRAHAHQFIVQSLEQGYDTNIGEQGKRLSGGQRQRVALARAILRDPKILILDEPTSAVDTESEFEIHESLQEFMSGRITMLVTHHLPSLEYVSRIAVMESGKLVDVGTHEQLLARCETYRRLFRLQNRTAA